MGTVSSDLEIEQLRSDLKQLYDWSIDWQMLFNVNKCKVLHFGYRNVHSIYYLSAEVLKEADEEKDLGVIINQSVCCSSQDCK